MLSLLKDILIYRNIVLIIHYFLISKLIRILKINSIKKFTLLKSIIFYFSNYGLKSLLLINY
jgi:hypothetical protein